MRKKYVTNFCGCPYTVWQVKKLVLFHLPINTMKKLIATLTLAVLAFAPMAMAEDVTYVAGMTGVV